jgi:hypothetical protein
MSAGKACPHVHGDGRPCGAPPMATGRFCFFHDPDKSAEAEEARRLGGLRRRKERTVSTAYDVAGLASVADLRRALEIAYVDALSLENSPARIRLLMGLTDSAARLLEAEREEAYAASLMPDEEG